MGHGRMSRTQDFRGSSRGGQHFVQAETINVPRQVMLLYIKVRLSTGMTALSTGFKYRSTSSFRSELSILVVEGQRPTQPRRERFET